MLGRRGVGAAVFGGTIAASLVGVFVIALLYVIFEWMREGRMFRKKTAAPGEPRRAAVAKTASS